MSVPSVILAASPVFYYRLGESGTADPVDSSANARTALLSAPYTWSQAGALDGDANTALLLSGGFISVTRAALTGDQTRLAWIKTTSTDATADYDGDAACTIMGDTTGGVWDGFGVTDGKVEFRRFNNSTWQTFTGSTAVNDGNWHMVAATYNSSTRAVVLYVDGASDGGGTVTAHQAQGGINVIARGQDADDAFAGTLDEIAAFDSVLSGATILDLWTTSQGAPDPPSVDPEHLTVHDGTVVIPPYVTADHLTIHDGTVSVTPAGADQTIAVGYALREPVAYGPLISQPGTVVPDIVAKLFRRDDLVTPVVTFDQAHTVRWLDQLNEPGSGSISLQNDDPDLASVQDGDLIRFELYGYATLTFIVRERERVSIAENEEVDEVTSLTGPGHLALLEEALVYPARGVGSLPIEEDRIFNWASVDFDDSAWVAATSIVAQSASSIYWTGLPSADWVDGSAEWIWASSGSQEWAPPGTCYFRHEFTLSTAGRIVIYLAADDSADLYFDGQKLIDTANAGDPTEIRATELFDVSAGTHLIAVVAANSIDDPDLPPETHNPAGILVSVHAVDGTGIVDPTPITHSDDSWLIVEYPPNPPGMSPGEVVRHCVEEAQARGALIGLTLAFTDEADSDGEPWDVVTDIATRTGTDVLTFLRELSGTYIDMWMAPAGLELWLWRKGGRGESKSVSFHAPTDEDDPLTGNLAALTHRTVGVMGNATLVRWHGGWAEREDTASSATYGRQEALLGLGAIQSAAEVDRIADEQLAEFADPRAEIVADLVPIDEDDTPYLSFLVGDTIEVPDENGDPTDERVIAMPVSMDENGMISFVPELKDAILSEREATQQAVKKMSNGTLRGASKVAQPVSQIIPSTPTNQQSAAGLPPWCELYGTATIATGTESYVTPTAGRMSATMARYLAYEEHGFRVLQGCDVLVTIVAHWVSNATGIRVAYVRFEEGGIGLSQTTITTQDSAAASSDRSQSASGGYVLDADDLISPAFYQSSGGDLDVIFNFSVVLLERSTAIEIMPPL